MKSNIDCEIDGYNIFVDVENECDSFSFINAFTIPNEYRWELHWDKSCLPDLNIVSKSVNVDEGDNKLYALFINKNDIDEIYLYEIILHRKYETTISFYVNGSIEYQDKIYTHELYKVVYESKLDSSRQKFNFWEDSKGNKVSGKNIYIEGPTKLYANITNFETETITVKNEDLSDYVKIENVRVVYEFHDYTCSSHPYVEFDVIFKVPVNALTVSNADIKVTIGGNWSVQGYSSYFYSGYDEVGRYVNSYTYGGYHMKFTYNFIDLENGSTSTYKKHFKAETSGNACNKELLSYNIS